MTDNLEILISARLNQNLSSSNLNADIQNIQSKLKELDLKINLDNNNFADIQNKLKVLGDLANNLFSDKGKSGQVWIDNLGGNLKNAIIKVQTEAKQGVIDLAQLQNKLLEIKDTYGQLGAFNGNYGIANEKVITDAMIQAEKQRTANLQQEQQIRMKLEQEETAKIESEASIRERVLNEEIKIRMALADLEVKQKQQALKQEQQAYAEAINSEMNQIKAFYDMKQVSAEESLRAIEKLINDETQYFIENQDKRLQALKMANQMETEINAQQNSKVVSTSTNTGSLPGITGMATMMATFSGLNALMSNIQKGIVDINTASAGLRQVFGENAQSQEQLNQVTNNFISIAQQYGASIQEVMDAAKLWGRQYKDLEIAQTLANNATLLSVVDNLKVVDANKAVESSLNSLQMSINNASDAQKQSMLLIDSWSAVSHSASVSAQDLTLGFERSAASARQAGLDYNQLNAIIAAGVRNTGRSGSVIGNSIKTILDNITSESPKVVDAFNKLGISMNSVDSSGQQHLRPVWDLILELSQTIQHATPEMDKYYSAIAGGRYQFDTLLATISNTKTLQDNYTISLNSQGTAQKLAADQMHTMQAEMNRLSDAIQKIANDTNQNGLGAFLKEIVVLSTDFINGLQRIPPIVYVVGAVLAGLTLSGRLFSSVLSGLKNTLDIARGSFQLLTNPMQILTELFPKEIALTNEKTVALARLTSIIESNAVAEEQLAAKSALATLGLDAESVAAKGATASFVELDVASAGITLAIGAAIAILGGLTIGLGAVDTSTQQLDQSSKQLMQTYIDNKGNIDQLVSQYDSLSQKQNLSADDTKKLNDVQNQLNQLMPQLTQNVDKQGQAHLKSAEAIDLEIKKAKELADLEAHKNQLTKDQNISDFNKNVTGLQDQMLADQGAYDLGVSNEEQNKRMQDYYNLQEQLLKSYDDIITKIQSQAEANLTLNGSYDKLGSSSQDYLKNLAQEAEASIKSATSSDERTKIYNQTIDSITKQGKALADASVQLKQFIDTKPDVASQQFKDKIDSITSSLEKMGISQAGINSVLSQYNSALGITSNSTFDLATFEQNLGKTFSDTEKKIEPLNNAIDTLNKGHELSAGTIKSLIEQFPELYNSLTVENGHLVLNKTALENVRTAQINLMDAELTGNQTGLASLEQTTLAKLHQWGIQIQAIQSVADAENAANKLIDNTIKKGLESGLAPSQAYGVVPKDVSTTLNDISAIGQAYEKVNALKSKVGSTGGDFVTSTNTSGGGASSSSSPYDTTVRYDIGQWTIEMRKADEKLKDSQNAMEGYNKTSAEYRNELQKQVDIYKQKQDIDHRQADSLRTDESNLLNKIHSLGYNENASDSEKDAVFNSLSSANKKNLNDWLKQLDEARQKVSQLGNSWEDAEKSISKNIVAIKQSTADMLANNDAQEKTASDEAIKKQQLQIDATAKSIQDYSKEFSKSGSELSKHNDDVQIGTDYLKAYHDEQDALTQQNQQLSNENQTYTTHLNNLNQEMDQLNKKYQNGEIDIQNYQSQQKSLQSDIDNTTKSIDNNTAAINANKDSQVNNAQATHDKIVEILQKTYQDQKSIEEQRLKDQYDSEITPLKDKRQVIEDTIKSLQKQWQVQQDIFNLVNLQNQLQNEASLQNNEYIDASGHISYSFDISKVTDLERQLQNEKTKQAHDAQINQLQDQKDNLDLQIQNITNNYNQQKDALNQYWSWKMSQDNLNQEADNLIQQNGLDKSLSIVQDYRKKVETEFQKLQDAAIAAGKAISAALSGGLNLQIPSGGSGGTHGTVTNENDTQRTITNGIGGTMPVSASATVNGNDVYITNGQLVIDGIPMDHVNPNSPEGQWAAQHGLPQYKDGGWISSDQVALLHSDEEVIGQKLTSAILSKFGVKPSQLLASISNFMPSVSLPGISTPNMPVANNTSKTIHIEKVELPGVTNGESFVQQLESFSQQFYYNTQAGGLT